MTMRNSTETEKLIDDPLSDRHFFDEKEPRLCTTTTKTKPKHHPFSILLQPFQWLQMLSSQLNPSFLFGVLVVYGLNQGFAGSLFKVVSDYYWKDVQKVQPSSVQLYLGFYYIPWVMKPIWGLLTDVFPVKGYHRRPYFVFAGLLGAASALAVAVFDLQIAAALLCLIGLSAGVAIADVTIDACIAKNSIEMASLAPDMQSLCSFCSSAGALLGYSTSGFFVHHIGAQEALGILALPPALLIVLGFIIYEVRGDKKLHSDKTKSGENLLVAIRGMRDTIRRPQVWKPSLYMYLSIALSISTHEGHFYWYTDPHAGPAFSQQFVGIIHAVGAMASMVGVVIYQKTLKNVSFRKLLFSAQLLYGLTGMLDLAFVRRWNLAVGIPDSFFVITEECVARIVSRMKWMPMVVLSTKLCPIGIEGTFFAVLMCIDSLGSLTSKWGGGMVLHFMGVTRTNFNNLWLAILVRNLLTLSSLGLIFLVPEADQSSQILVPSDDHHHHVLSSRNNSDCFEEGVDRQREGETGLQLVSMNHHHKSSEQQLLNL